MFDLPTAFPQNTSAVSTACFEQYIKLYPAKDISDNSFRAFFKFRGSGI